MRESSRRKGKNGRTWKMEGLARGKWGSEVQGSRVGQVERKWARVREGKWKIRRGEKR